jgi:hypothetical protein
VSRRRQAALAALGLGARAAMLVAWMIVAVGVGLAAIGGIGLAVGDQSTYEVVLLCLGVTMVALVLQ